MKQRITQQAGREALRRRVSCGCVAALLAAALLSLLIAAHDGKLKLDWRQVIPRRPGGIIIHHTATPDVAEGRRVDAAFLDEQHARRGWAYPTPQRVYHIGYHYVILRDGTVQAGRPEWVPGSHTVGHNDQIGVCLVGNFSSGANPGGQHGRTRPTPQQLAALDRLLRRLIRKYHFRPNNLHRHRDYAQTACPGDRFPFEQVRRRAFADR